MILKTLQPRATSNVAYRGENNLRRTPSPSRVLCLKKRVRGKDAWLRE